uniref:Immunoglobulin subtype domain-containing protein n=1 Tax=Leptobrachium leishanense TaxID=445787 RepID=A0A8C5WCX8_9ANUR
MAFRVYLLSLITWATFTEGCITAVLQRRAVLVALRGDEVSLTCDVHVFTPDPENIISSVHRDGVSVSNQSQQSNENMTMSHNIKVDGESSTYYCHATCAGTNRQAARGTFIHVRDSGYVDPVPESVNLQSGLITLFVLLLLLSVAGTFLLLHPLFWKDQRRESLPQPQAPRTIPDATRDHNERADSLYTSLQSHSNDVYDVLDDDSQKSKPRDQKCHVQVHNVVSQSPTRKPKPGVKPKTANPEKTQRGPERPPLAPKPLQNMRSEDSSVYENVKR